MISISSNWFNLKLQNALMKNIKSMSTSLERLMTGLKVNSAKDDPAGFYISSQFKTQISGLEAANTNIQKAMALLTSANEHMTEINSTMGEIRDLVQKSTNEYLSSNERKDIQKQINALFEKVQNLKNGAQHSGQKLFSSSTKLDKNTTYYNDKATATTSTNTTNGAIATASTLPLTSGDAVDAYTFACYSPDENTDETYQSNKNYDETNLANTPMMTSSCQSEDDGNNSGVATATATPMMMSAAPAAYSGEENEASEPQPQEQNAGIATCALEGGVAAYSGEETQGEGTETEYTTGEYVPLDGLSEEENAQLQANAQTNTNNTGLATTAETTTSIDIATKETKTLKIGGKSYTIYNGGYFTETLKYIYDDVSDQIEFYNADCLTITAASGQNDNIVFDIRDGVLYTGVGNDIITNEEYYATINAGDGYDTITNQG